MPHVAIAQSLSVCCGFRRLSSERIVLPCPAKLNAFLEVRSKRPDGFHELETVMLRTSLADQLTMIPESGGALTLRFSDATPEGLRTDVPMDERNLILKAAHAFRRRYSIQAGADFILHKCIPPESGLAGGSSNAASALIGCRQLWRPETPDAELHELAASLGSDLNFLLSGHRAAVCRGRGEIVQPIPVAGSLYFVALRPAQGNSTADVFRTTKIPREPVLSERLIEAMALGDHKAILNCMFNRLTEAAREVNPAMSALMRQIETLTSQPVFMSGSGSTVFVMADSRHHANQIRQLVQRSVHRIGWILEC
jgi:4-diphosphocytidyl-2-C-methyl-D-erythritol kinase